MKLYKRNSTGQTKLRDFAVLTIEYKESAKKAILKRQNPGRIIFKLRTQLMGFLKKHVKIVRKLSSCNRRGV
jgi:hypothetical protein